MEHKIYFCSDTHFGHSKEFMYKPRGFDSIWEHDQTIIANWNAVVGPDDEVFHLGDVFLVDNEHGMNCLRQLNGKIHIIRGNHCTDTRMALYPQSQNVVEVCTARFFKYKKYHFYLSHYPCLCGNYDDGDSLKRKCVSLCGHRHCKNKYCDMDKGLIYHVELDCHNNKPILLDTIIEDIKYFISLDKNIQTALINSI